MLVTSLSFIVRKLLDLRGDIGSLLWSRLYLSFRSSRRCRRRSSLALGGRKLSSHLSTGCGLLALLLLLGLFGLVALLVCCFGKT